MNISFFILMLIVWVLVLSLSKKVHKLENTLKQIVLDRQRGQMGFTRDELDNVD